MSIKNDILIYSDILDRMQKSLDTFTFKSSEEKAILINLLEERLKELHEKKEYVDYWISLADKHSKEGSDWKDPRL